MSWQDVDQEFFTREIASFLPDRIFDAHCHWWPRGAKSLAVPGWDEASREDYRSAVNRLHAGRTSGSLVLSFASPQHPADRHACNQWVSQQLQRDTGDRGFFLVQPGDDPEWVRDQVRNLGLHGFKCYHTFATRQPTWNAEVNEYLPEPLVQVAHQESWWITLHLVRPWAVADDANVDWIMQTCRKYPHMRLILAHAARGFQPSHNLAGLPRLRGLDNLYFDTSANCEPIALQAVLRYCGHERLLYGTDFPVSHLRGKHVAAADSFLWLYDDAPIWGQHQQHVRPVLVGLEHLRTLKWACWSERLQDHQVEAIFYGNAVQLWA